MSDPKVPAVPAIPWYKSPVMVSTIVSIISALLAVSPKLVASLGTNADSPHITTLVETVFGIIALIASAVAAHQRATSTVQPLTLTQAAADTVVAATPEKKP